MGHRGAPGTPQCSSGFHNLKPQAVSNLQTTLPSTETSGGPICCFKIAPRRCAGPLSSVPHKAQACWCAASSMLARMKCALSSQHGMIALSAQPVCCSGVTRLKAITQINMALSWTQMVFLVNGWVDFKEPMAPGNNGRPFCALCHASLIIR